ncbi:MAG: thioredoxin family protein [Candidatus Diapherotrites archaeon]|uniref:Thioredoxin family protein n=1 Tax=Candidatus Iainarchaeum sp. TaxID=3101447 RepID=A0A8T3YLP9_9ARCH|nr:thioredoxin family protein [Candidatus Diapherotrites archaeon]
MDKYLKAFILTLVLLAGGIAVTRYIDDSRISGISRSLEEAALDSQSTQQLLLYESVFSDSGEICAVLPKTIDVQVLRIQKALSDLEAARAQSLFADYELLKRKYLNQNIELYLYIEKAIRGCGSYEVNPVLFFYSDRDYCADCISQGKVLDSMHAECPGMRVFAVPSDLGIPVVEVLKERYEVSSVPAIVVDGKKFEGLQAADSASPLRQALSCR